MEVSSIESFKKYGNRLIKLNDGLVVEIQNPSLINMVAQGKIPNALIPTVHSLLNGKQQPAKGKETDIGVMKKELKMNADIIEVYVIASLVNPKYEDVKDLLTDEHKSTIATEATQGVQVLQNF